MTRTSRHISAGEFEPDVSDQRMNTNKQHLEMTRNLLLRQIAKNALRELRGFGCSISAEYVQEAVERLADPTEEPRGGPEMFIVGWLEEAGIRSPRQEESQ